MGRRASGLLPSYTSPIASPVAGGQRGSDGSVGVAPSVASGSGVMTSPPRRGSQCSTGSGDHHAPVARGKHGFPLPRHGYLFTTSCSAPLEGLLESRALRADDRKERLHRCGALVVESARLLLHAADIEDAAVRHMDLLKAAARGCCATSAHGGPKPPAVSVTKHDGELTVTTTTTTTSSTLADPCPRWWPLEAEVCVLDTLAASRIANKAALPSNNINANAKSAIDIYRALRQIKRRDVAMGAFTPPLAHAFLAYMAALRFNNDDSNAITDASGPSTAATSPANANAAASGVLETGATRISGSAAASASPGVMEAAGIVPANLTASHTQTLREEDAGFVALHDTFDTWVSQRKYEQYLSWDIRCVDVEEKGFYQLEVYVLRAGQYELYKVTPQVPATRSGGLWTCAFPPLTMRSLGLVHNHSGLRPVSQPPPPPEDPRLLRLLRARTRSRVRRKADLLSSGVDVRDLDPWREPCPEWLSRLRVAVTLSEPIPVATQDALDTVIVLDDDADKVSPEAMAGLSAQHQAVVATGQHRPLSCHSILLAVSRLPPQRFTAPRRIPQFGAGYVGELGPADSHKHSTTLQVPLVVFPDSRPREDAAIPAATPSCKDPFASDDWEAPHCGRPGVLASVSSRSVHVNPGLLHVGLCEVLFEAVRDEVAAQRRHEADRARAAKQRMLSDLESNEPLAGVGRDEWRRRKQEVLFRRGAAAEAAASGADDDPEKGKVGVALPLLTQQGAKGVLSRASLEVRQVTLATHKQVTEEKQLEKAAKATKKFFRLLKSRPQQADEDPYDGYYA
jgi:hypothetical protein